MNFPISQIVVLRALEINSDEKIIFSLHHSLSIIHRVSSKNICISIVLSFSWNDCNRPLSRGGHFESQGNKKLCFCTSSLALNERLDVQNLLFEHCVIKVYTQKKWKHLGGKQGALWPRRPGVSPGHGIRLSSIHQFEVLFSYMTLYEMPYESYQTET